MSLRALALTAGIVLTLTLARDAVACAGCRNPSLAVTRGSEGPLGEGTLRVTASLTGTAVHVTHPAGCADSNACSEVPVQPLHSHDQRLYPVELRLGAEYALNQTFGVELQVPFRSITTSVRYTTPGGAPYAPLDEGNHHRNETVAGPADPWLLLRAGTALGDVWLAARPGVSIPLGKTEEDPFELGDRGLRHQHIQLGTGTFDPVLVLEASAALRPLTLDFFAQGQAPLYENSHGYRAPLRLYAGLYSGTKLGNSWRFSLGPEIGHEEAERWNGVVRQDGNLGRTELLAAGSLGYGFGDTELTLSLRVPVARHIVTGDEPAGELSSPLIVTLSASHSFGAATAAPRHGARAD